MNVTYGMEISDDDDDYIRVAQIALDGMAKAAHPGAFLVDIFPMREAFHTYPGSVKRAHSQICAALVPFCFLQKKGRAVACCGPADARRGRMCLSRMRWYAVFLSAPRND